MEITDEMLVDIYVLINKGEIFQISTDEIGIYRNFRERYLVLLKSKYNIDLKEEQEDEILFRVFNLRKHRDIPKLGNEREARTFPQKIDYDLIVQIYDHFRVMKISSDKIVVFRSYRKEFLKLIMEDFTGTLSPEDEDNVLWQLYRLRKDGKLKKFPSNRGNLTKNDLTNSYQDFSLLHSCSTDYIAVYRKYRRWFFDYLRELYEIEENSEETIIRIVFRLRKSMKLPKGLDKKRYESSNKITEESLRQIYIEFNCKIFPNFKSPDEMVIELKSRKNFLDFLKTKIGFPLDSEKEEDDCIWQLVNLRKKRKLPPLKEIKKICQ